MKKTIVLLALIALFVQANCLFSQESLSKVKGGYKQCTHYTYIYKYGEIDSSSKYLHSYYKYDNEGNRIEWISNVAKFTYKYDNIGNMIEEVKYNSDGSLKWKNTNKYDDKRNIIEKTDYSTSGCITKETYRYDDKGNEIQQISYNCDGMVESKGISIYDNNGRIITMEVIYPDSNMNYKKDYQYDAEGKLKSMSTKYEITTINYDDKGNKTDEISLDYDGSTNSIERFDVNGNSIEFIKYFKEDLGFSKRNSKYDKYNRLIENSYETNGLFDLKQIFQYDEFGNIKSSVRYGSLNEPEVKVEYIYTK